MMELAGTSETAATQKTSMLILTALLFDLHYLKNFHCMLACSLTDYRLWLTSGWSRVQFCASNHERQMICYCLRMGHGRLLFPTYEMCDTVPVGSSENITFETCVFSIGYTSLIFLRFHAIHF